MDILIIFFPMHIFPTKFRVKVNLLKKSDFVNSIKIIILAFNFKNKIHGKNKIISKNEVS
jgi:hypothetical protein